MEKFNEMINDEQLTKGDFLAKSPFIYFKKQL